MIKRSLVALYLIVATSLGVHAQGFVATQNLNVQVTDNSGNPVTTATGSTVNLNNRVLQRSTYNIVCDGDSITIAGPFGNAGWVPGYCGDVAFSLSQARAITVTYASLGMSGYSWAYSYTGAPGNWPPGYTMISTASTVVDSQIVAGMTNVLVGFAGTNGVFLGGNSAATEYAAFQTWFNARTAAGWAANHIIVVTMLPRQDSAGFDTTRATYNADLKSFCMSNGCLIADAGGDATIGCNGCEDNTNCYLSDKIHLNGVGFTCGGIAGGGMAYLASLIVPLLP